MTDDHFAKAAGQKAAQNPAQSVHAESRTNSHEESKTAAPLAFANDTAVQVPPRGVVRTANGSGDTRPGQNSGPDSGPVEAGADALDLLRLLAGLTPEERRGLLEIAREAAGRRAPS